MSNPFVLLYKLFEARKKVFYFFLFILVVSIVFFTSKLSLKEDISAFIPKDEKAKKYQEAIKNLKANDRLIVNCYLKDYSLSDPDLLTQYAEVLVDSINNKFDSTWVKEVKYKVDDETAMNVFDLLYTDLPYYLEKEDYEKINLQLKDSSIYEKLKSNYETIVSPEGTALKSFLIKDPLGLNNYALNKLSRFQSEENFELYNGYFLTKNHKNLFIYLTISYPSNDSQKNTTLIDGLTTIISGIENSEFKTIKTDYFGTPAISVSNIKQIKKDSLYTTIVALVLIFVGLIWYFKNLKTILLIFVPVLFGAGFALAFIYLYKGEISAIAVGTGSIVLGIAINYSLHYFTHLKHENSVVKVIADLTLPLTLGCVTTVGAFLCLNFMQSEALQDMGVFAAMSLIGAAFCCLIILPQLSKSYEKEKQKDLTNTWLDKLAGYAYHKNKALLIAVVVLTILFAFYYDKVGFETDMTKLSYVTPKLQDAEDKLDKITDYKLKSVFLIAQGATLEEALKINETTLPKIQKLTTNKIVKKYANVADLYHTETAKKEKIRLWKEFWSAEKINTLKNNLYKYGSEFHFKGSAFNPTLELVSKDFNPKNDSSINEIKKMFLSEYITETKNGYSVFSLLKINQEDKSEVYTAFENLSNVILLDRGSMATMFAKILSEDFNLILLLSALLVFGFLLLSYGRVELAILAFLPMLISWIWILGIMGITGFKFNIVNIIICTFIFGLGDDYSIFTIDGLEQEYKYGKNVLASYRNSIFLSAYTTIVGIGVLIFAKHPALKSIALVTIIGITCIVFVSMVIQPFLYEFFVLGRKKKRKLPITFYTVILSFCLLVYFFLGSIILKIIKIFSVKMTTKLSLLFIGSINSYILFIECKFGENNVSEIIKNNIEFIPYANVEVLKEDYFKKRIEIPITTYYRGKLIKNYIFKGPVLEWYTRIKIGLEGNYKIFDDIVPVKGKIVDIGCGYGYLSYMLNLAHPERHIVGIDYDEEKIEIAQNGVLKSDNLNFYCSDVLEYNYEKTDVFIISDVLHYISEENQAILIKKCIDNLNESGVLIIRDGNSELEERHKGTKLTEFFSTKLLGFNKVTIDKLCFTSKEKILSTLVDYNVSVEILDTTQYTSNIIFIIRKR